MELHVPYRPTPVPPGFAEPGHPTLLTKAGSDAFPEGYRPDIDGLRAVAVAAVIAFHAFPSLAPGGFIGVDVFFIISGYLISGLIFGQLKRGRFSIREFYYRRIKRIFPALIAVLIACFIVGSQILLSEEFKKLGSHIVSAALFIANFKYWSEAGYFDAAAETKPLLHLWSLAVEEQFYLLWPALVWAAWRLRLNLFLVAVCIAVPSFILNVVDVQFQNLPAAFYSPGTRFWELMLGTMLAWAGSPSTFSPTLRNCQSAGGFALIFLAVALIARDAQFPGWWAVLPTAGTALIINAGPQVWLNRIILSHPAFVGFGLISYPLYLWHWPLLSFAAVAEGGPPAPAVRITAVMLSIILAFVTYKIIEKPIRYGDRNVVAVCAALCVLMLAIGLIDWTWHAGWQAANHDESNVGECRRDRHRKRE